MVKNDFGIEALSMLQKAIHELWALDPIGISRPVFDVSGGHELTPLSQASNEGGL
jgi:hypothetical protein